MQIDLTKYVIAKWGPWLKEEDACSPTELRLGSLQDGVTLAGPVRVRVAVQARNQFTQFGSAGVALQSRDVYCYTLDIAPGQMWTYPSAQLNVATLSSSARDASGAVIAAAAPAADAALTSRGLDVAALALGRDALWGANAGFGISIRPAGSDLCADPCATDPCRTADPCDPRPPRKKDCHCGGGGASGCGCRGEVAGDDLPCDYATGGGSQLGRFFPAACEPCAPGAFVGTPPIKGPSLLVPPARGGTVRTRYFNGMFITKEDLWTDQNNNRIKHALMNRAMGQGVVWGLDVAFDGDAVCVLPGYAVDCCGNDIVISSPYRVDAEALVRDPAAAAPALSTGGARRMNLLLEYFECPEQPRPVHGDPCAPDSVSCEMSRIRETGRLRLVPPCDVDDSGPIKDFLDEVRRLKGDSVVGTILSSAAPAAALPVTVPLSVLIEGLDDQGVVGSHTFRPKLTTDSSSIVTGDVKGTTSRSMMSGLRITVTADRDGDFQIVAGEVVKQAPQGPLPTPTRTSTTIVWNDTLPGPTPVTFTYVLNGWKLRHKDGTLLSSPGTVINLRIVVGTENLRMKLAVEIQPSQVDATSPVPATFPCLAEACDPDGRLRFPVAIPWLHPDPQTPHTAADPKVIVLAILYAVSISRIVQSGPGATDDVRKEQEEIAAALNVAAWRLLYGNVAANEQADLVEALRKLFAAWCKALLYPGPRCECGCDPHGVVIGCVQVERGTIRTVDPWGGRRWVVHYPLLAYWGKQFGIEPLDALASRLFDLICCVAHVYPSRGGAALSSGVITRGSIAAPSAVVPFGSSVLIFDEPANVARRLADLGLAPARTETVGPTEFIALAVEALRASGATAPPGATLVHYTVTGLSNMHFVTPAATASGLVAPPAERPGTRRAADMVRTTIAARPPRTAVPEALRDVTATLTHDLLGVIAPEPATEAATSVRDDLTAAGITSVAGLLNAHPEDLHVDILNREKATGLADLLSASEKRVASVAKAVGDTMRKFAADRRIASGEDLARPQIAAAFAKALGTALKGAVPAGRLTTIVDRVGRGGTERR